MKLLFTLLLYCATTAGYSQTAIDLKDVSKHVGDSITVEGKIYGVKILSSPASPTLLDLGAAFPDQLLTIAVFPTYKSSNTVMPTEDNKGNVAKVSGKIELYKGRPQIVVRSEKQLSFSAGDAAAPAKQ